ncbi:MAG: HEAT repeat domain-containing protein [Actinomycetia bacterium]|nr:HEAT repeat domain-containing protein [Actinomycetes bacterium]
MTDADAWRRVAEAGHTGNETTARESAAADDPVLRELSLGALERMGKLTDDDLRAAFNDADHSVRRRGAIIAAKHRDVTLIAPLNDAHDGVVEAAAFACGEHEAVSEEEFATLVSLATAATEPLVREAAVAALGAIGDERGLAAILAGCVDKPAIRRRAVLALAPFSGPEVDAALQTALQDRDWQVRQAAEDLLADVAVDEREVPQ